MTHPAVGYASLPRVAARRWPNRVALEYDGVRWTYLELEAAIESAEVTLRAAGIRRGMRTVLLIGNRPEYILAQFAIARIGAAFVMPNSHWTVHEIERSLDSAPAGAAVYDSRHRRLAARFDIGVPVESVLATTEGSSTDEVPAAEFESGQELCIPFSSGTTGLPKGIRHTHGSLSSGISSLVRHLALDSTDHLQISLPLCHIFGTSMTGAAFAAGARITLFERFEFDACVQQLREGAVTVWPLAGSVAHQLDALPDLSRATLPALRYFMWGGSAVPRELAARITTRTGIGFLCSYGMTESFAVTFNRVDDPGQWRLDSPGFATEGTSIRLTDEQEIEIRSMCTAAGYTTPVDAADDPFRADGWFRTGDVGRVDDDGRLWIIDRRKDMIKVSGFQVPPAEVEMELTRVPGVIDAGVVGVPDPRTGERVVAFVVTDESITRQSLAAAVSDRLATYKRPRDIVFVATLPRTDAGKLQRARLRQELTGPGALRVDGPEVRSASPQPTHTD